MRFECNKCSRRKKCKGPIEAEINDENADILVIGESPGTEEEAREKVFIGPAGKILRSNLESFGKTYNIINACCCYSPNKPTPKQLNECSIYWENLIDATKPKLIIVLGSYAAKITLKREVKMADDAGIIFDLCGTKAIVNYHPAYMLHLGDSPQRHHIEQEYSKIWEQAYYLLEGFEPNKPSVTILKKPKEIEEHLQKLSIKHDTSDSFLVYDYETWGDIDALRPELNNSFKILTVGVSDGEQTIAFPMEHPSLDEEQQRSIKVSWKCHILSKRIKIVAHNSKYEHKCNYLIFGVMPFTHCTMLRADILDENAPASLAALSRRYEIEWSGYKPASDDIRKKPIEADLDELLEYCGLDAITTYVLNKKLHKKLQDDNLIETARRFENYARGLAHIEINGIKIEPITAMNSKAKLEKEVKQELIDVEKELEIQKTIEWAKKNMKTFKGFNPRSSPQMQHFCLDILNVPVPTKMDKKGRHADLSSKNLEKYEGQYPVLDKILQIRSKQSCANLVGQWLNWADKDQIVHSEYHNEVVVTGRLSSTKPNHQQIPRDSFVRRAFISRFSKGLIISADYSQLEPRTCAGLSQDKEMIEVFKKGLDLHLLAASVIYKTSYEEMLEQYENKVNGIEEKRYNGKQMNLANLYGQTEYGLSKRTKLSIEEAKDMLNRFKERFSGAMEFKKNCYSHVMTYGWTQDLFGRRRRLPDAKSMDKWKSAAALRRAAHFPIASTANQFCLLSLASLQKRIESLNRFQEIAYVIANIHDALLVDCKESEIDSICRLVKDTMEEHNQKDYWKNTGVKLKVDVKTGPNYFDMEEWNGIH